MSKCKQNAIVTGVYTTVFLLALVTQGTFIAG